MLQFFFADELSIHMYSGVQIMRCRHFSFSEVLRGGGGGGKHKNMRKCGKLQEDARPIYGSSCVNTFAYFHLSYSSINLSSLLLKLPNV